MSESKSTTPRLTPSLTEDQKLAAHLFVTIYPHMQSALQRETDAVKESARFAKMVLDHVKENF